MYARTFTPAQRAALACVQSDLPDSATPFADIAKQAGIAEAELLTLLRELVAEGSIRRFGATLRHQKAGYGHNAMVAWRIPDSMDAQKTGQIMAQRKEISHCYIRRTTPQWPFNLYTMIHGKQPDDCSHIIAQCAKATGLTEYAVLESVRELKKTSMQYFTT